MFESTARLHSFLSSRGMSTDVVRLSADASTRDYFRISWDGTSAIACVYPEGFDPPVQTFLNATRLFLECGLPVADVMDFDGPLGVIIQEDMGDTILSDVINAGNEEVRVDLINKAVRLIARIQAATDTAFRIRSIASKLRFDTEKLMWELDYFKTHYFETYLQRPLSEVQNRSIRHDFRLLSEELDSKATVLCHRDFHAANLMIDAHGRMRIIDHQDARIGSPAYDLVSLLLDRITTIPSTAFLLEKQELLLTERSIGGLADIDSAEFEYEFRLQTIQRCLKAAGTFAYQSAVRGKTHFLPYIPAMLQISLNAAEELDRFEPLQDVLRSLIGLKPETNPPANS